MTKDYSIIIGGAAGQGSRAAGLLIGKMFSHLGYRVYIYDDYQSLIRGGHSFSQIRISDKITSARREKADFLLALDKKTIEVHKKDLAKGGLIIYNKDRIDGEKGVGIEIEKITKEMGGIPIMANVALLAAFSKIIGVDWDVFEEVLKKDIRKKIELNLQIAKKAYDGAEKVLTIERMNPSPPQAAGYPVADGTSSFGGFHPRPKGRGILAAEINQKPLPLLTGNEAIAVGAAKAGLNLYIAYPMTPATSILHFYAAWGKQLGIAAVQLENEIAVINAAIGGVYAGAKTMVGTSGGGFALMTEALSFAAQGEIPLVIVESQRAAPATGVPTYSMQADLLFTLFCGHGDFTRFIIAPGDADEACLWAAKALNLSWKYQTPSILLVDKEISENTFTFNADTSKIKSEEPLLWDGKGEYARYKITKNGISPLAFPGDKTATVKATSYEHDEFGITAEESEKDIKAMQDKRLRKFETMRKDVEKMKGAVEVYGKKTAKSAIIAWGSNKGVAREAAENLGIKFIQPVIIDPFPLKQMKEALRGVKNIIDVETNAMGQMAKVLSCNGITVDHKILKYTSRPFFVEELESEVKKVLQPKKRK